MYSNSYTCMYIYNTCTCRFGGFLIQQEIIQTGDMLAVFFAVIIGAFALGQAAPNVESLLTAAGAAGEIFETIDRVRNGWPHHLYMYDVSTTVYTL